MAELEILGSFEEFLFSAPPYKTYTIPQSDDLHILKCLYGRAGDIRIDGHCPYCNRSTTFTVVGQYVSDGFTITSIGERVNFDGLSISCVRDRTHIIEYYFRKHKMTLEKIGQYPSLATIANDEVTQYRKNMEAVDAQEFHKAIGLAAHGVGVGSFVYLRRVFERLIYNRFNEFKDAEGWSEKDFQKLRMPEKIDFLKVHLPPFLVENGKIYSILSIGIHELDEKNCLGYFNVMKHSIMIILDEDKRKKEELEKRKIFAASIASFNP